MENQNLANPKIFFSYSRVDGEKYALQLAGDLRSAGADVWIDQLDIEPGKIWDLEVEKALNAANCVLFLATEKSTTSNNVLNEVYYAVEENKTVIPVLFHKCKIPFRLMRLQRVDFTVDYPLAFQRLLKALGLKGGGILPGSGIGGENKAGSNRPNNIAAAADQNQEAETPPANKKLTEETTRHPPGAYEEPALVGVEPEGSRSRKPLLWGAGLVVVAALLFFILKGIGGNNKGDQAALPDSSRNIAPDSVLISGLTDSSGKGTVKSDSPAIPVTPPEIIAKQEEDKKPPTPKEEPKPQGPLPDESGSVNNPKDSIKVGDIVGPKKNWQFNEKLIRQLPVKAINITAADVLENIGVSVQTSTSAALKQKTLFTYSLSAPAKYLNSIAEVRYQRNHPAFPEEYSGARYSSSTDRGSNFSFKEYQAIRLKSVFVTVVLINGTSSEKTLKPLQYSDKSIIIRQIKQ